jgi:ATP-binding cassette subfamily B protein
MNTTMTEQFNVSGALLVKLFGKPEREAAEFADKAGRVREIGIKTAMLGRVFFAALGLLGAVGTVLVYWLGTRLVIEGALTVGTLTALALYVARLYGPLTQLTNAQVDVMTAFVSFERVFEVLDAEPSIVDSLGAFDLIDPHGRIDFDGVWFRYPAPSNVSIASLEADVSAPLSDEPSGVILKGVSFTAQPGEMVALVGPTGAGKTTLCNLVPRLYDVTAGVVRVDGHDVRDLTQTSLAAAIGMVTQDPHLFHDTIGANLRYAKPDADEAELVEACKLARIHDLIASLPDGYDTIVGERGYRLSGGEKQRLALARVLLKSPAIVILDEATAHLDSETELLVQQALAEALAGRTSLVIAHRLSTIQAADQILVMDDGRIVERGTHTELVERDGLYRELYLTQYARPTAQSAGP